MKRITKFMQLESHLRKIKCVRESTKTKKCTRWRSRRECSSWGRHRARVWRRARAWWRWSSCFACVATQKTFVLKKKMAKSQRFKKIVEFSCTLSCIFASSCLHPFFFLSRWYPSDEWTHWNGCGVVVYKPRLSKLMSANKLASKQKTPTFFCFVASFSSATVIGIDLHVHGAKQYLECAGHGV